MSKNDTTIIIVNYKTPALTEVCYSTVREQYKRESVILVDNGSTDESTDFIKRTALRDSNTIAILNEKNLFHGPALHQGMVAAETRYVFTLDSDCRVMRPFLRRMLRLMEPGVYAVGQRVWFCRRAPGHAYDEDLYARRSFKFGKRLWPKQELLPRIHPARMLIDRERYLQFRPFQAAKEPELETMEDAYNAGFEVVGFSVKKYISHQGDGTRQGLTWDLSRLCREEDM